MVNNEKEELTIFAINKSTEDSMNLECDIRQFKQFTDIEHIMLGGTEAKEHNSAESPLKIVPDVIKYNIETGMLEVVLPKLSWNVIRFKRSF